MSKRLRLSLGLALAVVAAAALVAGVAQRVQPSATADAGSAKEEPEREFVTVERRSQ